MSNAQTSIVTAILQADTAKAEKNLKKVGQDAVNTGKDFDRLRHSSKLLDTQMDASSKSTKMASGQMRQLRRAGRDLDGALMDLGQGVSLLSPALGHLVMNLSDSASILEGVGRIGTLFTNPMFKAMGIAVAALGGAFALFVHESEQAKKEAEDLAKEIEGANKRFNDQITILDGVSRAMGGYISQLNTANNDLLLLTGAITQFELAQDLATQTAEKFRVGAQAENKKEMDALFEQINARETLIRLTKDKLDAEIANTGAFISQNKRLTDRGQLFNKQLKDLEEQRDSLLAQFKNAEKNTKEIDRQARIYDQIGQKIAKTNEERRITSEIEKENKTIVQETAIEYASLSEFSATVNKDLLIAQQARNKLEQMGFNLTKDTLTEQEKIKKEYDNQLSIIRSLAITAEDLKLGEEIETQLLENKNRLLEELIVKEKTRLDILREQANVAQDLFRLVGASISAIQSPESFVSGFGGLLGGIAKVGGPAALGAVAPAVSAAGSALSGVAGLGGSVQEEIDRSIQARESALASGASFVPIELDEDQAQRVVLGNMQTAFSNFLRDLERGFEILPEILVGVLPEFIGSLVKVIQVDLFRLLTIDLPASIALGIINGIGFVFADFIDTISLLFDNLKTFFSGDFERRSKEERQSDRRTGADNFKQFLKNTFPGIEAGVESLRTFAGGGSFIPHAAGGMRFTGSSRQGLAMLHQNEFVVPASGQRPQSVDRQMSAMGGGISLTVNAAVVEQNAIDALVRKIEERFNSSYGLASSNLFGGR